MVYVARVLHTPLLSNGQRRRFYYEYIFYFCWYISTCGLANMGYRCWLMMGLYTRVFYYEYIFYFFWYISTCGEMGVILVCNVEA